MKSHLLSHYLLRHKSEMRLDQLEYGMRVRTQFKTALERQVGEAVVISREKNAGTTLLNSKAEYNRCKIHRIETRLSKSQWLESQVENETEEVIKREIQELQKLNRKKRSRNCTKVRSTETLEKEDKRDKKRKE